MERQGGESDGPEFIPIRKKVKCSHCPSPIDIKQHAEPGITKESKTIYIKHLHSSKSEGAQKMQGVIRKEIRKVKRVHEEMLTGRIKENPDIPYVGEGVEFQKGNSSCHWRYKTAVCGNYCKRF